MSRFFVKLIKNDVPHYLVWSTVVDSPISDGMPLEQFKEYFISSRGKDYIEYFEKEIEIADRKYQENLKFIRKNRAGKNEKQLTIPEIIALYCKSNITEVDVREYKF